MTTPPRTPSGPHLLAFLIALTGTAHAEFDFIRLVDTATAVPGQPGFSFVSFDNPAIEGDTVVFRAKYDPGSFDQEGIYTYSISKGLKRITDESDPIPGGVGPFGFYSPDTRIGGGRIVFWGGDASGPHEGVFTAPTTGGPLVVVAAHKFEVPDGAPSEVFNKIDFSTGTDGNRVIFLGNGDAGTKGTYVANADASGNLTTIADTNTPIPGGGGELYTGFLPGFQFGRDIDGSNALFPGEGPTVKGIYSANLISGGITAIVDNSDPFPGAGGGTHDTMLYPRLDGNNVVFFSQNAAAQFAVITTDLAGSSFNVIADRSTIMPGTIDQFDFAVATGFEAGNYVLIGSRTGTRTGLYTNLGGPLERILDSDSIIDGKPVAQLLAANDNLSGSAVTFSVEFEDGSQAIYATLHAHRWLPNAGGSWDNPANWTFGTLPRPVAPTFLTPENGAIVTGPTPAAHLAALTIGAQSSGLAELALQSSGHLRVDGPLTIQPSGKLKVRGTVSVGGGLDNDGILAGHGQLDATLDNTVDAEVQIGTAESLSVTGAGNTNTGTMSVINGDLRFTQDLTNSASTGFIFAQDALLQFDAGLQNFGALATSFGNSTTFGDITNHPGAVITMSGASTMTFIEDLLNNGAIQVSTGSRAVYFGTVSGTGSFPGGGVNCFEGDLRPGASPAQVDFGGHVEFGIFSEYVAEIGGTTPGSEYDRLEIAGSAQLAGTLAIALINGFPPALGDTFTILNASGGIIDTFAQLDTSAAPLDPGLTWQVNYTANAVELEVISTLSPFEQWIASFPSLTNPADQTTTANPDNDPLNNLAEFALDDDPTSGLSSGKVVVKIAPVGGIEVLTLTLPVRLGANPSPSDPPGGELALDQLADALRYAIQAGDLDESGGLATWPLDVTEITGPDATAIQAGLPALNAGWEYRSFQSPGPVASDPRELMRVRTEDLTP